MTVNIEILGEHQNVQGELRHTLNEILFNAGRVMRIGRRNITVTGIQLTTRKIQPKLKEGPSIEFDRCTLLYDQNGHSPGSRTYSADDFRTGNFEEVFDRQY